MMLGSSTSGVQQVVWLGQREERIDPAATHAWHRNELLPSLELFVAPPRFSELQDKTSPVHPGEKLCPARGGAVLRWAQH